MLHQFYFLGSAEREDMQHRHSSNCQSHEASPSTPARSVIDRDSWRSCPECSQISAEPAGHGKEGRDPKLSALIRAAGPSQAPALQLPSTHNTRMALCLWARPCWQPAFPALTGEEGNCSHPGTHRGWAPQAAELWPSLHQGSYFVCFMKLGWGEEEIWRGFMGEKKAWSWDFWQISNKIKAWQIFTISRRSPWWMFQREVGEGRRWENERKPVISIWK